MFKHVILHKEKLNELKHFYVNVLELPLINSADDSFTIQVGGSTLSFKKNKIPAFYHFAFNIPGNKVKEAKHWLQKRVQLNLENGHDEIYYPSFDADALYFEDPAGNVVEFIGRRNRKEAAEFTSSSLLNISEMSITTPFVIETAERLIKLGIESRNMNPIKPDSLNFLGKDDTYIIVVPPNRRWYFSKQISKTFPLEIVLIDNQRFSVDKNGAVIFR